MEQHQILGRIIVLILTLTFFMLTMSSCTPGEQETFTPVPAPAEQNQVAEYASQKGLPQPIIDKLQHLGYDGMNQNEKALIDHLYGVSQAEVVSREVLEFVPSNYEDEVTQSLQTKVIDAILSDGEVSSEGADGLIYLSTFPGKTQRDLIEFGLDDTSIDFLVLNSSLKNQAFAKYAVENRLCIQNHELTNLERSFLEKPEEYAQVLLNDYLSELSRTYPELAEELGELPDLKPNTSNSEAVAQEPEKVYLLISSSIYESLKPWTDRWIEDVEKTGVQMFTKTIGEETPGEIRALLQNTPNLSGCLMLGDIPAVKYEMDYTYKGKSYHEEFPTDLYYMDLDGDWLDADNDGTLDTHKGNISPEIWVGRLKASNLPALGNEMELLKNYFDKNHLYRVGALTLPDKALLYIDDTGDVLRVDPSGNPVTYPKLAPEYDKALSPLYKERVVVTEPEVTIASDYLERLEEGWSLVRTIVHSGGFGHYFKIREEWDGKVLPEDISQKDPKAFFYIIISCENFDYTRPNYMGGCYLFSKSYSLLAIGDSGVHDVLQVLPEEFFPRLTSEYFGSAFLHYLQECVKRKARIDSVHNAIMIGDPLLTPVYNGKDSDGDGLTDQYELTVGLNPYDIDTDQDGLPDLEEAKFIEFLRYTKVYSIEAVEDIFELASSNDPEVKEAFELMIKGGTPDPSDLQYGVPNWNTGLQVLYWLADQNEFEQDDTLAQAIAMSNGLWVTMGDDEVREAVYGDTHDLLNFFRETNEIQKAKGYYQLEDYPLEAKVCLGWTGSLTPLWGHHGLSDFWLSHGYVSDAKTRGYVNEKLGLKGYDWDSVSIETLREMRKLVDQNRWVSKDISKVLSSLEDYFYFSGRNARWEYATIGVNDKEITLDGELCKNWQIFNNDAQFNKYLSGEKVTGGCADETSFIDAWCKSWGISSTPLWHQEWDEEGTICGHYFLVYYNPSETIWEAFDKQLKVIPLPLKCTYPSQLYIFRPPVKQQAYLKHWAIDNIAVAGNMFYMPKERVPYTEIQKMFLVGVPTSQMKEWILYP